MSVQLSSVQLRRSVCAFTRFIDPGLQHYASEYFSDPVQKEHFQIWG